MIIETSQSFNQFVKNVHFFPYEWSASLLAVCFSDSIKLFNYEESTARIDDGTSQKESSQLKLLATIPFDFKVDNFNWNPKTHVTSFKPFISFAVNDYSQNLLFCSINLSQSIENQENENESSQFKTQKEKFDVDCIYSVSYDTSGDYLAFTADNYCFLWSCVESRLKQKFLLQSPGINICWHRDEKTKFMVGERAGTIRIYSTESLKPIYSLVCLNPETKSIGNPLLSFDWCQLSPEHIIANTNSDIYVWNTAKSSLPEIITDSREYLKVVKFFQTRENLCGYKEGSDACAKLIVMNFKNNQVIYQSKNMKLLESFSFNSILPLVAVSNEQQLMIIRLIA